MVSFLPLLSSLNLLVVGFDAICFQKIVEFVRSSVWLLYQSDTVVTPVIKPAPNKPDPLSVARPADVAA